MSETTRTRGRLEVKKDDHGKIVGRTHQASHPAHPTLHLGNSLRTPEPVADLLTAPDLTGTFLEFDGRYRLMVNHAGPRLECLLTLVTNDWKYTQKAASLEEEVRIPKNWVKIDDTKRTKGSAQACPPIVYRLSGVHIDGGMYALEIPFWADAIGKDYPVEDLAVGTLQATYGGQGIELNLDSHFLDCWPFYTELSESKAKRVDSRPVLLERYLDDPAVPWEVRTEEWFPPTPKQQARIDEAIRAFIYLPIEVNEHYLPTQKGKGAHILDIHDLLAVELEAERIGYYDSLQRRNILTSVDTLVQRIVDRMLEGNASEGAVGQDHVQRIRGPVLANLDTWMFEPVDREIQMLSRSVLTMLLRALDRNSQDETYPALERYLGLSGRGWRKHRYSMEFEVFEVVPETGIPNATKDKAKEDLKKKIEEILEKAGSAAAKTAAKIMKRISELPSKAQLGFLTVRYQGVVERYDHGSQHPNMGDELWVATYWVTMGGMTLEKGTGQGAEISWDARVETWSNDSALPEDLEGWVSVIQYETHAGFKSQESPVPLPKDKKKSDFGGVEVTAGAFRNIIQIWGRRQSLSFSVEGPTKLGGDGGGVGASGTIMGGQFDLLFSSGGGVEIRETKLVTQADQYWQNAFAELALHFEVNGARFAIPTEEEKEIIRQEKRLVTRDALAAFAAYELPLLSHPFAKLELIGHTDMPDTEAANRELSEYRAQSVYNMLRSFLGKKLMSGMSQQALEDAGRLSIVGKGETEHQLRAGDDQENQYDPRFRKTELKVSVDRVDSNGESLPALDWILRRDEELFSKE